MKIFQALAIAVLAFAVSAAAAAPGQAQTLDRILKEKKIRITAELTSPPFGIINKDGQPDGAELKDVGHIARPSTRLESPSPLAGEGRGEGSNAKTGRAAAPYPPSPLRGSPPSPARGEGSSYSVGRSTSGMPIHFS